MKNLFKFIPVMACMAVTVSMTSCSDDNDEPKEPVVPGTTVTEVFPMGVPSNVDGATVVTDAEGRVTKVTEGTGTITFEYGKYSRATEFQGKMTVTDTNYPDEDRTLYLQFNEQGFVKYALEEYKDSEETDEWWFDYNADGCMTMMKRTEGGDKFAITYSNGDITKVVQDEEDGDHREFTFSYTNDEQKTVVANVGGIMLYDEAFRIDMDEMTYAYYAGLLGKATKNLPMAISTKAIEGDSPYESQHVYHWTLNAKNLPVKFWEDDDEEYGMTIAW